MTKDEFQKKYHSYRTPYEQEAKAEARKVNEEGIEGDKAVAIQFGDLGWALMLASAASFAEANKLIPKQRR